MEPTKQFGIYFGHIRRLFQRWASPFKKRILPHMFKISTTVHGTHASHQVQCSTTGHLRCCGCVCSVCFCRRGTGGSREAPPAPPVAGQTTSRAGRGFPAAGSEYAPAGPASDHCAAPAAAGPHRSHGDADSETGDVDFWAASAGCGSAVLDCGAAAGPRVTQGDAGHASVAVRGVSSRNRSGAPTPSGQPRTHLSHRWTASLYP